MSWHEQPLVFDCEGDRLIGIVARPDLPHETGVVIIVGGPQYRAGSHRQFTLLARQLADENIASIRFDYRGMGDSGGGFRNFEHIDADIRAAIDNFMTQVPEIKQVALWGLCDAASAALYYGHTDPRVNNLILLNPWVHSEAGAARARLKHYYLSRLLSKSFWEKLLSGKVNIKSSVGGLAKSAQHAANPDNLASSTPTDPRHGRAGYIDRMLKGLNKFRGGTHIILSGKDLTAQEFMELTAHSGQWRRATQSLSRMPIMLPDANHTFSSARLRSTVSELTTHAIKN